MLMSTPRNTPPAALPVPVLHKRQIEGRSSQPAEFVAAPGCRSDLPPRHRCIRLKRRVVAQQKTECTAIACGQDQSARCSQIGSIVGEFGDDSRECLALERL